MKRKRLLALCLSVIMLLSVFSIAAYAEDLSVNTTDRQNCKSISEEDLLYPVRPYVDWVLPYCKIIRADAVAVGNSGYIVSYSDETTPIRNGNLCIKFSSFGVFVEESTNNIRYTRNYLSYSTVINWGEGVRNDPLLSSNPNAANEDWILKVTAGSHDRYSAVDYGFGYLDYKETYPDELVALLREKYPNAKIYGYDGYPDEPWDDLPEYRISVEVYANVYRLYNPNSGEHFFTVNNEERDWLTSLGWKYEGVAWYAPGKKENPVYRVYNPNAGDHHYTTSATEKDRLVSLGWRYEGIAFYSPEQGGTAIKRVYNPNAVAGSHFFTQNTDEYNYLVSVGWTAEGTGFYGD